MRRAWLVAAVLLLAGCNLFAEPTPPPGSCNKDQDCAPGQSCFVDGCGTLPDDMLAEVTTSVPAGVASSTSRGPAAAACAGASGRRCRRTFRPPGGAPPAPAPRPGQSALAGVNLWPRRRFRGPALRLHRPVHPGGSPRTAVPPAVHGVTWAGGRSR
jgi:hypothetical protein